MADRKTIVPYAVQEAIELEIDAAGRAGVTLTQRLDADTGEYHRIFISDINVPHVIRALQETMNRGEHDRDG